MTAPSPGGPGGTLLLGPPGGIRLTVIPAGSIAPHLGALAHLAHAAFTPHPWYAAPIDTARLIDRLIRDAHHLAFVLVLAEDTSGCPVGFAYGRRGGHLAALAERLPASSAPPFELRELAVVPHACGHGIGAALHDRLINTSPAGPRWLLTHPHAAPALALYRSRGWHTAKVLHLPNDKVRILMHRPW
ncbi:GNAT family N-acetyltransferase [Streptomyces sp. NPDC047022]|uniref:GNAT family N-acetyltransferase n=1 Tax=Streptomyces sp. NPDC047022 TaxID=3155737 RepID=UPI00340C1992